MPLGHFIKHITKMKDPALEFFDFFHYFYFLLLEMVMSTKKKLGSEDSTFGPPYSPLLVEVTFFERICSMQKILVM